MSSLFANVDKAFDPFADQVTVRCSSADGSAEVRRATVRATVFAGEALTSDAGARMHSMTGADSSVVISRRNWPWSFAPRFGMKVVAEGVEMTVQSVDVDEVAYTLRCTSDDRVGER